MLTATSSWSLSIWKPAHALSTGPLLFRFQSPTSAPTYMTSLGGPMEPCDVEPMTDNYAKAQSRLVQPNPSSKRLSVSQHYEERRHGFGSDTPHRPCIYLQASHGIYRLRLRGVSPHTGSKSSSLQLYVSAQDDLLQGRGGTQRANGAIAKEL